MNASKIARKGYKSCADSVWVFSVNETKTPVLSGTGFKALKANLIFLRLKTWFSGTNFLI